jgi:hypothetical protein
MFPSPTTAVSSNDLLSMSIVDEEGESPLSPLVFADVSTLTSPQSVILIVDYVASVNIVLIGFRSL